MLTTTALLCFLVAPVQDAAPAADAGVTIHALADEGFLLTHGETKVAIDAFVTQPYSIYAALDAPVKKALFAAEGAFAGVHLALASHVHRDHFQPEAAQRFLAASPATRFVSSNAVIDGLWETETEHAEKLDLEAIDAVYPDVGEEEVRRVGEASVTFLALSHVDRGRDRFGNMGHVIELGGVRALHVGDASMNPAVYAAYELPKRGLDVVFVPYWYFQDTNGRKIVEEYFRPAMLIACHIPPRELEQVTRELAKTDPDVVVFQEQLASRRFVDLETKPAGD